MNWRQKMSKVSSNFPKLNINVSTNLIKKTAVAALVLSAFSFHSVSANDTKSGLNKVYHVYIKDQYMGTVTDPAVIEKVIDEKTAASSDAYSGFHVEVGKDLKYIPEQVFQSEAENEETAKKVENQVSVLADAVAITVDGKPVVYLKDKESADQVMDKLKLSYATQKELDALEAQKSSSTSLPPLKEDETRLVDVSVKESLGENKESVDPGKILKPEEAVKYLQKGTLEEKKYQVQDGDVLGTIASKNNLTTAELLKLNPGIKEDSVLKIGSDINVASYEPLIHVIMKREVYKVEPVSYEKKVVEDSSMFKGDTKVVQEGKEGKNATTYVISEQNGQRITKEVKDQKVLSEPVANIVKKGTKVMPSRGSGSFAWPAVGGYVSSEMGYRWGKMHKGLDIARPSDRTIKAADNGVVVTAGFSNDGYGNKVVIDHKNGYQTLYAHMSSVNVKVGQTVTQGSKIGVMGETGEATGVHLHFEVRYHGKLVNPRTKL